MNEKERVYQELARTRRKCAALKTEVENLKKATDARENAALRREAARYRTALSHIAYRLDNGGIEEVDLRSTVESALLLRGLKVVQREAIARAHSDAA